MLYFLVVLCAGSAIVQGMDQTAVNGAQQFYFTEFGIEDVYLQGLLNGAPYLCSVLIRCWTNAPLNVSVARSLIGSPADGSAETHRSSRYNLCVLLHVVHHRHLDGSSGQLVQSPRRPFLPRPRSRRKVFHHTRLCRRECAEEHSRRTDDDVANVDGIR